MTKRFMKVIKGLKGAILDAIAECEERIARLCDGVVFEDVHKENIKALVIAYIHCDESIASGCIDKALQEYIKDIATFQGVYIDSYYIGEVSTAFEIIGYFQNW